MLRVRVRLCRACVQRTDGVENPAGDGRQEHGGVHERDDGTGHARRVARGLDQEQWPKGHRHEDGARRQAVDQREAPAAAKSREVSARAPPNNLMR